MTQEEYIVSRVSGYVYVLSKILVFYTFYLSIMHSLPVRIRIRIHNIS